MYLLQYSQCFGQYLHESKHNTYTMEQCKVCLSSVFLNNKKDFCTNLFIDVYRRPD